MHRWNFPLFCAGGALLFIVANPRSLVKPQDMAVPVNSATSGVGYGVQNGVRFRAHRHARGHRNSPPDCCYPDGLPCSSLSIIVEQKKQGKKPCFFYWSGLRDSNSLPPPWQGGALPDELNPQTIVLLYPAGAGLSSPFFADGNKKCRPLVGITIGTTTYR